jgi:hypothetical protein
MIVLSSKRQLINFKTVRNEKIWSRWKKKDDCEREIACSHQKNDEEHFK